MTDGSMAFRRIEVSIASTVAGRERTALSQYYNLYFQASWWQIWVYRPQFPNQQLLTDKVFKINLPLATGVQHPGYIEERVPHAVNQLYVGDLGTEEILVCVCDDGDVLVYKTRSIDQAITQRDLKLHGSEVISDPPTAFFVANVRMSCWGIAIHKAARMIAVSANTHIITVFAFALDRFTQESEGSDPDSDTDLEPGNRKATSPEADQLKYNDSDTENGKPPRSRDLTINLEGHITNIPNIAFCNTDEDIEGRFLVSTDIEGVIIVWDIWRNTRVWQYRAETIWDAHGIPGQLPTMGWSIMCLDYRAFRPVDTTAELLGCQPLETHLAWGRSPCFQRIQNRLSQFQNLPLHSPASPVASVRSRPQFRSALNEFALVEEETLAETSEPEENEDTDESEESRDDEDSFESNESRSDEERHTRETVNRKVEKPLRASRDPNCLSDEVSNLLPGQIPFLIFWTSDHDLLLMSPNLDRPVAYLRKALAQHPPIDNPYRLDRLNMVSQIPELGIIIAASQIGRIALITLARRDCQRCDAYAFRVDWIVPFENQESKGHRPDTQLLGVAVGPIQGQQLKPESILEHDTRVGGEDQQRNTQNVAPAPRRYRLMLTYYDMTVLTYEIGRSEDELGGGDVISF